MTDLSILGLRRAGPADLDAIAALEAACFGTNDGAFTRHQLRALLKNPNAFWLLSLDGRAMACWLRVSNGRARWARLYSLAVHPALRGQGWGKRLLEAGFTWMRQEDLSTCRAEVMAGNHVALRLYRTFGFRESTPLPDYYAPGVDGVRLATTLPAEPGRRLSRNGKRNRAGRPLQSRSAHFPGR